MKFRSLTYNSVDKLRKLKVEDDLVDSHPELRITHEQFIQALDVTDPFTQQLIEILVKVCFSGNGQVRSPLMVTLLPW
ncbi:hypothetical protein B0J17DRAFT_182551 [Rhizoctonia solani]|nr:hypothetical protein B0J17DRAFT_182551 [Rhizoctonia solani]